MSRHLANNLLNLAIAKRLTQSIFTVIEGCYSRDLNTGESNLLNYFV